MKYTRQFQVDHSLEEIMHPEYVKAEIKILKEETYYKLGEMICSIVGIEEMKEQNDYEPKKYIIEVDAFSSKDWSEFKHELKKFIQSLSSIGLSNVNLTIVGKMIKELENKGIEKIQNQNSKKE